MNVDDQILSCEEKGDSKETFSHLNKEIEATGGYHLFPWSPDIKGRRQSYCTSLTKASESEPKGRYIGGNSHGDELPKTIQ